MKEMCPKNRPMATFQTSSEVSNLRICRISKLRPCNSSPGAGLVAYKLSEYLPYPCLYITKALDGGSLRFPDHVTPMIVTYPEGHFAEGLDISWLRTCIVFTKKAVGNAVLVIRTFRRIREFKPNIVHVHAPSLLPLGLWVKLVLRHPLVLTFHGTDYYRFRKSRILRWLVRKYVDCVICIAPDMLDDLERLAPGVPATYVPNGVDLSVFTAEAGEPKQKQIVSVGRLSWQKGYSDLLEAMATVVRFEPAYRLVIVGDGPLSRDLRQLARQVGIGDKVDFLGMVPQIQVAEVLRQSELFVMSSITEGFPKALLEAMACSLPVVVTDVGACGTVAQEAGLVVPPSQPGMLADAILSLIRTPALYKQCSKRARAVAERYDWRIRARKVQTIYEALLRTGTQDAEQ